MQIWRSVLFPFLFYFCPFLCSLSLSRYHPHSPTHFLIPSPSSQRRLLWPISCAKSAVRSNLCSSRSWRSPGFLYLFLLCLSIPSPFLTLALVSLFSSYKNKIFRCSLSLFLPPSLSLSLLLFSHLFLAVLSQPYCYIFWFISLLYSLYTVSLFADNFLFQMILV